MYYRAIAHKITRIYITFQMSNFKLALHLHSTWNTGLWGDSTMCSTKSGDEVIVRGMTSHEPSGKHVIRVYNRHGEVKDEMPSGCEHYTCPIYPVYNTAVTVKPDAENNMSFVRRIVHETAIVAAKAVAASAIATSIECSKTFLGNKFKYCLALPGIMVAIAVSVGVLKYFGNPKQHGLNGILATTSASTLAIGAITVVNEIVYELALPLTLVFAVISTTVAQATIELVKKMQLNKTAFSLSFCFVALLAGSIIGMTKSIRLRSLKLAFLDMLTGIIITSLEVALLANPVIRTDASKKFRLAQTTLTIFSVMGISITGHFLNVLPCWDWVFPIQEWNCHLNFYQLGTMILIDTIIMELLVQICVNHRLGQLDVLHMGRFYIWAFLPGLGPATAAIGISLLVMEYDRSQNHQDLTGSIGFLGTTMLVIAVHITCAYSIPVLLRRRHTVDDPSHEVPKDVRPITEFSGVCSTGLHKNYHIIEGCHACHTLRLYDMSRKMMCLVYTDKNFEPNFFTDGPDGSLIAISKKGAFKEFMWNLGENRIEKIQATTEGEIKKIQAACYNPWHRSLIYTECGHTSISSINLGNEETAPLSDWPVIPLSISIDDSLRYYASDGKRIVLLDANDGTFLQTLLIAKSVGGIWDVKWCRSQPHVLVHHGFGYRQISYCSVQTCMSD